MRVAFTTGRAAATLSGDLQKLIGVTTRLVLRQFPFVAVLSAITWWVVATGWPLLALPFGVVVVTFVLTFPLRIFQAVLQGMQDLTFLAGSQSLSWIVGTAVTVGLVASGFGIQALAIGWMCTQVVGTGLAWRRAATRYKQIFPSRLPPMALGMARAELGRGIWMSVSQVAQVLLNGTDLLIIGMLLGPAAIVPYACTGKLLTILASQPQLFMQTTLPALSELRTSVPQARLFQVSTSMSQLLLLCSGAIACVVLAVNESFVSWWVGEARFAGVGLTAVLVLGMLLRHWNLAAIYTLFCFGNERRLALTTAADGILGVVAMLALVPWLGLYGAAVGSLIGTATVSLPLNLSALARQEGVRVAATLRPLGGWFGRFAVAIAVVLAAVTWWPARSVAMGATAGSTIALLYLILVVVPVARRPPLGTMLSPRLQPVVAFLRQLARRPAGQATP